MIRWPSPRWAATIRPVLARDIVIFEGLTYLADGPMGLRILNMTDLNAPVEVGYLNTAGTAEAVELESNFAFVADGEAGVQIIKITKPDAPVLDGTCDTPGYAQAVMFYGGAIYTADGPGGLRAINKDVTITPCEARFFDSPGTMTDLSWYEGFVYAANSSALLGIESATMTEVGSYQSPALPDQASLAGDLAYLADPWQGLRIIDVADPAAPALLGSYATPGTAQDVMVSADVAYLAAGAEGLRVLDVSDPALPTELTALEAPYAQAVAVDGDAVLLANGEGGLLGFQFDVDFNLLADDDFDTSAPARHVAISGGYGYVAADTYGVFVVDYSDLSNLQQVSWTDTDGTALARCALRQLDLCGRWRQRSAHPGFQRPA